jgi:hypothetical protein
MAVGCADRPTSPAAYIDYMRPRCGERARVVKPTGSFYYLCDWHARHPSPIALPTGEIRTTAVQRCAEAILQQNV